MKDSYDFSKGRRGRVVAEPPLEPGKVRITIRLQNLRHTGLWQSYRYPAKRSYSA